MAKKLSDIVKPSIKDDTEWEMQKISDIAGLTADVTRINFYSKDGEEKVFVGFSNGFAIATGSDPVKKVCREIRTALCMEDEVRDLPEPVTVTIAEKTSKSGRKYFVFE